MANFADIFLESTPRKIVLPPASGNARAVHNFVSTSGCGRASPRFDERLKGSDISDFGWERGGVRGLGECRTRASPSSGGEREHAGATATVLPSYRHRPSGLEPIPPRGSPRP